MGGVYQSSCAFNKRVLVVLYQSLYFLLRSAKEEFALRPNAVTSNRVSARPAVTEQALPMQMDEDGRPEQSLDTDGVTPNTNADNFKFEPVEDTIAGADGAKADGTATSTGSTVGTSADSAADVDKMDTDEPTKSSAPGAVESSSTTAAAVASVTPSLPRTPLEDAEEIMAILKTGHPLMVLTLETMVDQVLARLKASPEEDVHRIIMALLTDGYQQLIQRVATGKPGERFPLTPGMRSNIEKFLASPYVQAVKVKSIAWYNVGAILSYTNPVISFSQHKSALEADFLRKDLDIEGLVESYAKWRDTLEHQLEYRPRQQHLEHFSHYLVEFEHQRFDEVEIPGQYLSVRMVGYGVKRVRLLTHSTLDLSAP